MKAFISEYIGTFLLVFCGTGGVIINEVIPDSVGHTGIAITFGLIVMTMIYSLGDISGAHLNPAVTIAFAGAGVFPWKKIPFYWTAQLLGAITASLLLHGMFPASQKLGATIPAGSAAVSFILEVVLSFILMLVILQVATGSREKGMLAGIAIGSVVLLEAMFAGPVSGASMNPARSIGPALISGQYAHLWIYIAAPFTGMLLSVPFHLYFKS